MSLTTAVADVSHGGASNDLRQQLSDVHFTQSADPLPNIAMTVSTLSPQTPHSSLGNALYGSLRSTAHMVQSSDPGPARAIGPDVMDTTGQIAPPGMKPRVTATLWEDEGSLCFQVEAKGVCVARREDNHFINGTKLLNVAGMTRGRRDGILKMENKRHVVKIGPMHLKGVWIPFERALDFANKEKITDLLYPLFVHNIGGLVYDPENAPRTNAVIQATEPRHLLRTDSTRALQSAQCAWNPHDQNSIQAPSTSHSVSPDCHTGRTPIDRAHNFPTPPTSASSMLERIEQRRPFEWSSGSVSHVEIGAQPLSIDTGMCARSMPTTPASTPPGSPRPYTQFHQDQEISRHSILGMEPATQPGPGQHYDASAHDDSEEDKSANPGPPPSSMPQYTKQPLLENTVTDPAPSQAAKTQALGFGESERSGKRQKLTPPQVLTSAANAEAHGASVATLSPSKVASPVLANRADLALHYESTTDQEFADVLHIISAATMGWPSGGGNPALSTLGFLLTQKSKTSFSRWNESSKTKTATSTEILSRRPTVQRRRRSPSSIYGTDTTSLPQEQASALKRTPLRTGCSTCRERHLKCDGRKPNCQNCTKSSRRCLRHVRLNFIDIDCKRPPVLLPVTPDWKIAFQDDSRAVASEYEGGSVEARTFHEPGSDTDRTSSAISMTSTEDGIVPRSATGDKTIEVCSRVLLSAYGQLSVTNHSPPTETCGPVGPKTASKTGSKGQPQGSRSSQYLRKRRRADDDGSADEGNDRGKKFQRAEIEPPKGFERPLACPFNKFDNRLFGPDSPDEAYRSCATGSFVNIAHLKQHLRRNHYLPKHYCYRCCRQDFASDSMVAAHLREEPICMKVEPPRYRERIGPDFIEDLSLERKNTPGTGREEYWQRVYNTFFPGAADQRPVTPYYEGPVAEHLEQFLRFSYGVVGDLWAAVQRRADAPAVADQADMISIHHDILQQAGQLYLEHMASRAMPILGRLRQDEEASVRGAAPLDRQSHAAGEDVQRPGCHGRAGGPPNITTTESQDTGSSLTTASDRSSPAFPRTPQGIGATEHHGLQSLALGSQVHALPSRYFETGCESHAPHAEEANFSQFCEKASLHRLTSDRFDSPPQLPRDFNFGWDTEFDQMMKLNMDEWNSSPLFDGADFGRVD